MKANELRQNFIDFFVSKDHSQISGASLIPENDPTVLFTTAGMHPLVPYILGAEHPAGTRLVDYQKCIRTGDIDAVGDPHHLTFFEMLGNWSLGDYFKKEAIRYSYEFLTEWLHIDASKLSVTVFAGEEGIPRDEESANQWKSLGIPEERIYFLPREDNWWGPAGEVGPCGPDTEMFIDTGRTACGPECKPGCKCGKYFEIWNDVFMGYRKTHEGSYVEMERKCVDTGMGIERTIAILQGKKSVYETEVFAPIIEGIKSLSQYQYGTEEEKDISVRIIADHVRTSTFILGDQRGVKPSNVGQGYILRRLIRRAVRHGRKLGIEGKFLAQLAKVVIDLYSQAYPELEQNKEFVLFELGIEEEKFSSTLQKGEHEFEKMLPNLLKGNSKMLNGRIAFKLYDTFGFPIELTEELAKEHGFSVDIEGFNAAFEKHQEISRAGAEQQFKGGLADHSDLTTALHTATHLLHQALRTILGEHVGQKGSNITAERLRFDFTHDAPMTDEQLQKVEDMVNDVIKRDLPVSFETMTVEEAKAQGAIAFFDSKYGEQVKVYSVGDFSKEVCGGPHVEHTGTMGRFKIQKEQSSSAGVRRIKAVLEK
ncbi:MAG: alanine--tRNA ligase [Sphaerochaetaceae bacterium]|jgi:alanyl-tRNA synthetase|nr:alanine--tRNA ligase [Sphaerochaetaceae bacterium]MDD2405840.1 alanine--tRNA ligase [Sphaerochaetaceae bacterium]MDD4260367.1 alanine--tRNA ligase [Sphaerochaetaceae bacterium]MDD4840892.1 alanine--tRNA ligase [Sphaerochaetaceae bacterium]MDD5075843.1 alanine--tRNA ligase [Sphaerochaetaceae bacterium]